MHRTLKSRNLRLLLIVPCFVIVSTVFTASQVAFKNEERISYRPESRHLLQAANETSLFRCIPSGFSSFPGDFFSQAQRLKGGVIIHLLITGYICAMIAVVCDDYFIPSLNSISDKLRLPSDVAGATFMAIGTSAPELFSSITGSFVTEGDIGVGTIIGSAVFNILAVTGLVGLVLWDDELDIEWYPIARDCIVYGLTISCLIWIISDNIVTWWESLILLTVFALYIIIICYNVRVEKWTKAVFRDLEVLSTFGLIQINVNELRSFRETVGLIRYIDSTNTNSKLQDHFSKIFSASKFRTNCCCCDPDEERTHLLTQQIIVPELLDTRKRFQSERDSFSVEFTASREKEVLEAQPIAAVVADELFFDEQHSDGTLCSPPTGGPWRCVWWIVMYPANLLFFITIPDSKNERFRKWYSITFLMSVIWIGVLSYMAVWMVTIIGFTFSIPDSVSGLTILAAGTSVPEVISSIIVAKNGLGNMAISNLVGSNTFDISFCLGAPWLAKTLISKQGYLIVYSSAMTYTTATLLLTLVAFVLVFQIWHWKINRTVGLVCLIIYAVFVIFACLYELNILGQINVPTCQT